MNKYQIISDGSCDLSLEEASILGIDIVPFYIQFLSEDYKKEGIDIKIDDFYQSLVDNPKVYPKTSLPAISEYIDKFKKYTDKNIDVICLCISSKFSGSYNAASKAAEIILEENKNVRIKVIDTKSVTVLQGLLVKEASRLQKENYSFDELIDVINTHIETGRIFFTVKGLNYLEHGGRIGKVSSLIGDLLKVTPIITLKDGEILSQGVAISRSRSLLKIKHIYINYLKEIGATPELYRLAVGYGYDLNEAEDFYNEIKKALPEYEIELCRIGSTIAVHTGPNAIGVGLIKKLDK